MIMDLIKQSESYNFEKTVNNWKFSGTINAGVANSQINLNIQVVSMPETSTEASTEIATTSEVGHCYWSNSNNYINASYNIVPGVDESEAVSAFISVTKEAIEAYKSI